MRPATMILTTILLLGSAPVAAAECAWVLWIVSSLQKASGHGDWGWTLWNASPTHTGCQANRTAEFKQHLTRLKSKPGISNIQSSEADAALRYMEGTDRWAYSYRCLPDTVDPREKKK